LAGGAVALPVVGDGGACVEGVVCASGPRGAFGALLLLGIAAGLLLLLAVVLRS